MPALAVELAQDLDDVPMQPSASGRAQLLLEAAAHEIVGEHESAEDSWLLVHHTCVAREVERVEHVRVGCSSDFGHRAGIERTTHQCRDVQGLRRLVAQRRESPRHDLTDAFGESRLKGVRSVGPSPVAAEDHAGLHEVGQHRPEEEGIAVALAVESTDERFVLVGLVSASFYSAPACGNAPPAPIVAFHGTDDRIVPYEGGTALGVPVRAIEDIVADWAAHNGCDAEPAEEQVTQSVAEVAWAGCDAGANVVFHRIEGGGHTWPGGTLGSVQLPPAFGTMTTEINASEIQWEFFQTRSLAD